MPRLKRIRKQRKLLLKEVAERLGVSAQAVRYLEVHGIKKLSTAKKYAEALECSPFELVEL